MRTVANKPYPTAKWVGKHHYHGCTTCGLRYDDTCRTPEADGTCLSCRRGELSVYQYAYMPRPCCFTNSQVASKDDRTLYKLAGPGPWWKCKTCARQFTRQPQEETP